MGTNEQKQQKEQKEQSCKAPWQAWVEAFGSGKEGGRFGPPGCCTHFFGAFHQAASGQQEQPGEEEPESSGARAAPMGKGCCVPPFFGPGAAKEDAPRKEVHSADDIRQAVREVYSRMAESGTACGCDPGSPGSAGPDTPSRSVSEKMGYSEEELGSIPEGADMGLGCGNPQAIAALLPGETVLDLGSGGGLDCFLAARQVGETGRVIGVDMTPKMLRTARANAEKSGATNVEFRLDEIEHLPVADGSV
ncbi:MAG: methyltransferase domain-containing protein, partial [Planctomycetota bacterium]